MILLICLKNKTNKHNRNRLRESRQVASLEERLGKTDEGDQEVQTCSY